MKNWRHAFGAAMVALAVAAAVVPSAFAQGYPNKPVRIIVGFPPGQATDLVARMIAQSLTVSLGQSFYVENKPGAAGIIGSELAKNASPDGYTLLFTSSGPMAINPHLYKNISYDPVKDFSPIGVVSTNPLFLAVGADSPFNGAAEMIGYVKANPGKLVYASGGSGTTAHLAMELLKGAAGIQDFPHVPYKGSPPAVTDLMAGRVLAMFDSPLLLMPFYKSGKIKLLGVGAAQRLPQNPEVRTIAEQGLEGFTALSWIAAFAPAGTPSAILERVNAALNKALLDPAVAGRIVELGAQPAPGNRDQLTQLVRDDFAKWGKTVKQAGVKVD